MLKQIWPVIFIVSPIDSALRHGGASGMIRPGGRNLYLLHEASVA